MAANTHTTGTNRRWTPIVAVAVLLVTMSGTWAMLTGRASASGPAAADAAGPVEDFTAAEAEAVASVRRLYDAWGLEFPQVVIRFHAESTAGCKGDAGLYRQWAEGPATVDVCYPGDDPQIGHLMRARVLWHELGHAYIEPRADAATKAALLDLLDLRAWTGDTWEERGAEFAADIIAWGMMRGQIGLMVPDADCETLSAGFHVLTGLNGPNC